jgi:phage terminase large subunit-like protein
LNNLYFLASAILFPNPQGERYIVPHIHGRIGKFIQTAGRFSGICAPRGSLKTTFCTISYAVWRALRDPEISIAIVSNTQKNAENMVSQIRDCFLKRPLMQALFPEVYPDTTNHWSKEKVTLNRKGVWNEATFEAVGLGTSMVSRHYNVIIEDDTVAPRTDDLTAEEYVPSQEDIDKAIGFHRSLSTYFRSPKNSEIHVRGTRWGEYDLIGTLRDKETGDKDFRWLVFSALDENNEPVYPERFSKEELGKIRRRAGEWFFHSQYLNDPLPSAMCPFSKHIRYYDVLPKHLNVFIGVDPAISQSASSDFSVILALGIDSTGKRYVLEYQRGKYGLTALVDVIFEMAGRYRIMEGVDFQGIAIESVGYQEAISQYMNEKMIHEEGTPQFYVEPVNPTTNVRKEMRLRSLEPYFQRSFVFIGKGHYALEDELRCFPRGARDDCLDALYYANKLAERTIEPLIEKSETGFVFEELENKEIGRCTGIRMIDIEREILTKQSTRFCHNPAFDIQTGY